MKKTLVVALGLAVGILVLPQSLRADAGIDGAAIYKAKCASCHGADGKGQTAMGKSMKLRDLGSADVQKMTDADMNKIVADGKGKMPGYKGKLDQATIDAVIAHIRTFKK